MEGCVPRTEPPCISEGVMPDNRSASVTSLADSSLLHIFHKLCEKCGPQTPGICWVVPVCKQWRALASHVKRLRVLFQGSQQQQVASFRAWCRRHAGQVVALAITSSAAVEALSALAGASALLAAARGQPLPLQRLVVAEGDLLQPVYCEDTLQPLLAALPHLRHLHVSLRGPEDKSGGQGRAIDRAAATVLSPLQHSTSLTSLVLYGPNTDAGLTDSALGLLLSGLPPTLRSLTWHLGDLQDPSNLSFGHLTSLTHLHISASDDTYIGNEFEADTFRALQQLRKLELVGVPVNEEVLLACQEQLVTLLPNIIMPAISSLTHLQSLALVDQGEGDWGDEDTAEVLGAMPPLQRLHVKPMTGVVNDPVPWNQPWVLQHYSHATRLKALDLTVTGKLPALGLLPLTQLQQLRITMGSMDPDVAQSWVVALPALVNLQLLAVPAALTACWYPWLTKLTKLVVLELGQMTDSTTELVQYDLGAAAAHVSRVLALQADSSSRSATRNAEQKGQLQVLCIAGFSNPSGVVHAAACHAAATQLFKAVVAAAPVWPLPGVHTFRGSWSEMQECGVELWPGPVAARLQQLVLE